MSTRCDLLPVDELDGAMIDAMWALFERHYTGLTMAIFERDLRAKDQALLLYREGELAGFTSQRFEIVDGHRVTYSGDMVIARESRDIGTARFFHRWAQTMWESCDWWCALASGPRTYRIAHTFFRRITPNADDDESEREAVLRHRFADAAYGDAYDPESGIVRLDHPYILRDTEPPTRNDYPLNRYFREANPGWRRGDELVSLVSLRPEHWKPAALRMLEWGNNHA